MKLLSALLLAAVLSSCSAAATSSTGPSTTAPSPTTGTTIAPPDTASSASTTVHPPSLGRPVAVVTAETEHAVLEVSPFTGRVLRRVAVTGDPTTLTGPTGPLVVCSPAAGTVTILSWPGMRRIAVLHSFHRPEIADITPDGEWALVSDAAGTVSTINLTTDRIVDRVWVGRDAHHMSVSPNQRSTWLALGENASTIVRLDSTHPNHLRVIGHIHPPVEAHDIAFAPDGETVWVTSAAAPHVTVYDAANGRPVGTVPAGTAPQHVAFSQTSPARAYISSGYGRSLEMVDATSRRILHRASLPYGSFNLSVWGRVVATTSLFDGQVTVFNAVTLRKRLSTTVAPAAREIVLLRHFPAAR
jgi:DNA-binding beta-propeller fold protein YncE